MGQERMTSNVDRKLIDLTGSIIKMCEGNL